MFFVFAEYDPLEKLIAVSLIPAVISCSKSRKKENKPANFEKKTDLYLKKYLNT